MRAIRRLLLVLAGCCAGTVVRADPPEILRIVPPVVAPGEIREIVVEGRGLQGVTALWTEFPARAVLVESSAAGDRATFWVRVDEGIPVRTGAVRVHGDDGASSPRFVLVDAMPFRAAPAALHSAAALVPMDSSARTRVGAKAVAVTSPSVIHGGTTPDAVDPFRFPARAGEAVSIEVVAQRLGLELDAVLRVLDSGGREVAYSDDDSGLGADARLRFVPPADGDYVLELRDIEYRGGPGFDYVLRIGAFPLVTTTLPLFVPPGATTRVRGLDPHVGEAREVDVSTAGCEAGDDVFLDFGGVPSGRGLASVVVGDRATSEEVETGEDERATRVALPAIFDGRFDRPKDRDAWEFEAAAGSRWVFTARTRERSSPADVVLRLLDAAGHEIAAVDDDGRDDARLDATIATAGFHRLEVSELVGRGGIEFVYRIEARPYVPGFALSLDREMVTAPEGGVIEVKVSAVRGDVAGPIELELEDVDGAKLPGATIAEGESELVLRARIPESWRRGEFHRVRVVGRAMVGEREVRAVASTRAPLARLFPRRGAPLGSLERDLGVGVSSR